MGTGRTGRSALAGFFIGGGAALGDALDPCSARGAGGGPGMVGLHRGISSLLSVGAAFRLGTRSNFAMSNGRGMPVRRIAYLRGEELQSDESANGAHCTV